jgi:hypothetical protein
VSLRKHGKEGTGDDAGREDYQGKVGLLQLAKELKNVSRACRTLGVSRDSFLLAQKSTTF